MKHYSHAKIHGALNFGVLRHITAPCYGLGIVEPKQDMLYAVNHIIVGSNNVLGLYNTVNMFKDILI